MSTERKPQMTPAETAKAILLWTGGKHSLNEICVEMGRNKSTLQRLFGKHGVRKGLPPPEPTAVPAAPAEPSAQELRVSQIEQVKQESLKIGNLLQRIVFQTVATAVKNNKAVGEHLKDMQALKTAMEVVKIRREEAYALLQIAKYDQEQELENLPELQIHEVTDDKVAELVSAQQVNEFGLTDIDGLDDIPLAQSPGGAQDAAKDEEGGE